jgi:hypothetical protein
MSFPEQNLIKATYEAVTRLENKMEEMRDRLIKLEVTVEGKEKIESRIEERLKNVELNVVILSEFKWKIVGAALAAGAIGAFIMESLRTFL